LTCSGAVIVLPSCAAPPSPEAVPATTFPSDITSLPPGNAATARQVITTFPLLNGTFKIEVLDGNATVGTVTGLYDGEALQPTSGNPSAALSLQIQTATDRASSVVALEGKGMAYLSAMETSPSRCPSPCLRRTAHARQRSAEAPRDNRPVRTT
jgi:hypothetical protein